VLDRDAVLPMTLRPPTCFFAATSIAYVLATTVSASAETVAKDPEHAVESWQEGDPVPDGYKVSTRGPEGLVTGGAWLFGVSTAISVLGAAGSLVIGGPPRESWLFLPGFGPLGLMTQTTNVLGNVLLATDALAQLGGIAMLTYGLASRTTVLVRKDAVAFRFAIAPKIGAGQTGIAVMGQW
jgi:hypothetical protein